MFGLDKVQIVCAAAFPGRSSREAKIASFFKEDEDQFGLKCMLQVNLDQKANITACQLTSHSIKSQYDKHAPCEALAATSVSDAELQSEGCMQIFCFSDRSCLQNSKEQGWMDLHVLGVSAHPQSVIPKGVHMLDSTFVIFGLFKMNLEIKSA